MYTTADISTSGFDSYSLTLQIFCSKLKKILEKINQIEATDIIKKSPHEMTHMTAFKIVCCKNS